MTTTGTSSFVLDVSDLIEEAYELAGGEVRDGYDVRTAIRSMNLIFQEWANIGLNLWTVDSGSFPIIPGQITYNLPADTVDLLDMVIREGTGQNQIDINITRISEPTYAYIPNKNSYGRPIQVWINRQSDAVYPSGPSSPQVNVWPTGFPGISYTFVYWRLRRIQDAGTGANTVDLPFRFVPALTAALAVQLAIKNKNLDGGRLQVLQTNAEIKLKTAMEEDRDKSGFKIRPRMIYEGR